MDAALNPKALWDLNYGLYLVTSVHEGKLNGFVANTVFQVTADPPQVAVSVSKQNLTCDCIQKSGLLAVSILEQDTSMALISHFGFKSGREIDKFAQTTYSRGITGCPIVTENALSFLEGTVMSSLDCGTHILFLAKIVRADILKPGTPLTYAYYQSHMKGHASKNAPTYKGDAVLASDSQSGCYKCSRCGYIYDPESGDPESHISPGTPFEKLPHDWICPLCDAGKNEFFSWP